MSEFMQEKIGVVGLGYVGLPLATAFAEKYDVVGFDVWEDRVQELMGGHDSTGEVSDAELAQPLTQAREPDLTALKNASATVGRILKKGMMVSYESTVYPGVTEEICLPILEEESGLELGEFALGYSPERVNPGDKTHTVKTIIKIVSGHDAGSLARAERVYGSVVTAGLHLASNIKTAEAAKVIENVQRDLNIALMNELSMIFSKMDIRTAEVLAAAGTKWNFHHYHPGLVGGHCIGVDPYYLTYRAMELGYHPEVILAGRRINDSMGNQVGDLTVRALNAAGCLPKYARIWILGLTFKEDVPDFRNTRAVDVVKYLKGFDSELVVWEPLAEADEIQRKFGLRTVTYDEVREIDAVVVVNGHKAFKCIELGELKKRMRTPVLIDVKNFFSRAEAIKLGFEYATL